MIEPIGLLIQKISLPHLNILLLLGLALFGGTIGGRFFQKLRIPQVIGYICIGIVIGESGLKIIDHQTLLALQPFSYFALGLIGFMIGGELKKEVLSKYGKQFITILIFEGVAAFLFVTLLVGILGSLIFKDWRYAWALGILLGAISSATAPAATVAVLKEYKTRGPLTRMVLGIVAMDDALALFLFAVAAAVAGSLIGNIHNDTWRLFINPLYEITTAIALGVFGGLLLNHLLKYSEKEKHLVFCVGIVLLVLGLAFAIHVNILLAVMTLGVIITNSISKKGRDVFKLLEGFTPPIYVLFFVLVGAKLNINYITLPVFLISILYLVGRSAGKMYGAMLGAKISSAPRTVQKYLPFCLFSQAGVAIGLSILAGNYFPGNIGNVLVVIITATVFVLEIIGPSFVKFGVTQAGEVGLNISEEDFIYKIKIKEIIDKNPPLLYENMSLDEILSIFRSTSNLYYPLVNNENKLIGIISVDSIRNILEESKQKGLILATDLQEPVRAVISNEATLSEARDILNKYSLECLPVVTPKNKVAGFIERRIFDKLIATRILELQKQADILEGD
ncbi:MAG: cation:proton antiporter [Candidatus Marinimicrobia bacterium]|nr:cation:proton antiporter [Candidatus Neomarinimicrobiota bacterium]